MSLTKNPAEIISMHRERLQNIKCALFDVDGILTDGRVFYTGEEMGWNRYFNIYDGYGIKRLMTTVYMLELFRVVTLEDSPSAL